MNYFLRLSLVSLVVGILPTSAQAIDISIRGNNGITLELGTTIQTFDVGGVNTDVELWVFCESGSNNTWGCDQSTLDYPGPLLETGMGQNVPVILDLTSNPSLIPNEPDPTLTPGVGAVAAFRGHTLHFANLDLPAIDDGVPAPFPPTANAISSNMVSRTYNINLLPSINPNHVGSHAYYCHVHQTKHVEMGEFGALIVHPIDKDGRFLNYINQNAAAAVNPVPYDVEMNFILSTVDPSYHKITSVGDNPVFAKYEPTIFLVNGLQGLTAVAPAETIKVSAGDLVAIRLIGMHSVNATFEIFDSTPIAAVSQPFSVHNIDGWAQASPIITKMVALSPGQTKDILVAIPRDAIGPWYPVITYRSLRDDSVISTTSTVYTMLDF